MSKPMEVEPIPSVIMAEDYKALVNWYQEVLGLEVKLRKDQDYHYTDLAHNGKLIVGLCPASEMGHLPTTPRNNSLALHILVSDIEALFEKVAASGGKVLHGPAVDKHEGFKFGNFADPEGNEVWVIENFQLE